MKAAVLSPPDAARPDYAVAAITEIPTPQPAKETDVQVKLKAAALNHRDHWIRKLVYGKDTTAYGSTILAADGAGEVVAAGSDPAAQALIGKRVLINCSFGWEKNPRGPEAGEKYGLLGYAPLPGTLAEYIVVPASHCKIVPDWMTDAEAAAIPLASLTAWRALITKGGLPTSNASSHRVLICGIGGGVALFALQYAVAAGAQVYVTSSSPEKIERAKSLGAIGGVNYTQPDWPAQLVALLKERDPKATGVDIIIDGSGHDVDGMEACCALGASIVTYGATAGQAQKISITPHFLKQIEWKGSTMGSNVEFDACVEFITKHQIRPVIAKVFKGLESTDDAFAEMAAGRQFGKLVVEF